MKKKQLLFLLAGATVLTSCLKDDYVFENVQVDYSPSLALPLLEADLITKDLLSNIDSSIISAGPDDVLRVVFNDTIGSFGLDSLVSIDDIVSTDKVKIDPIAVSDMQFTQAIPLSQLAPSMDPATKLALETADKTGTPYALPVVGKQKGGATAVSAGNDFEEMVFSEGKMEMTVVNNFAFPLSNVEFKIVSKGTPEVIIDTLRFALIPSKGSATDVALLDEKTMSNNLSIDILNFESPGTVGNPTVIKLADELNITVDMKDMIIVGGKAKFDQIEDKEIASQTLDVVLDSPNGEELKTIVLASGSMEFEIDYGVKEDSKITFALPFTTKDGKSFSEDIIIDSDNKTKTIVKKTFDLTGYTIDLTKGGAVPTGNSFAAEVKATITPTANTNVPFDTSDVISFNFSMKNIKPASVKGYFGKQPIVFDEQEASTGFGDDELLKTITLESPSITMHFDNSFGLPMAFDKLNVKMTGGTKDVTLSGLNLPFDIDESPSSDKVITSSLVIDNSTTNIAEGINSQPTKFVVGGNAVLNPGTVKVDNFADTSSNLTVRVNVEVPLHGKIKNIEIRKTIDLDLGELFKDLKKVVLKSTITNQFPLEGEIQIIFVDAALNPLDSLIQPNADGTPGDGEFMEASATNAMGETVTPSEKITTFTLEEAALKKMMKTKKAILVARVSSGDEGKNTMKILSTYNLNVKLGLVAKIAAGNILTNGLNSED